MIKSLFATDKPARQKPSDWLVLIVDDEPQVHEVTRMLLANIEFCGQAVELHSTYSAEAARSFLQRHPETALVLLDVVMETDNAGLQLIHYIRETLANHDVQIVLRTGQPGQAPEQEVIINYDINGYFLKTDITAQRLHSILIAALRAYHYIKSLQKRPPSTTAVPPAQPPVTTLALSKVLQNGALPLQMQAQLELAGGQITGFEVFPCWPQQQGDKLTVADLYTLASSAGQLAKLGECLIQSLDTLLQHWHSSSTTTPRIALDMSLEMLQTPAFLPALTQLLTRYGVPISQLEFEFSETALQQDQARLDALQTLHTLEIGLVVDYFGNGAMALSQLKHLQPKRLKIDPVFITESVTNPDSAAITRAIIALAHTLDISVVALGVQTKEQLEFLKWEDCELGQGDFLAPRSAADDIARHRIKQLPGPPRD